MKKSPKEFPKKTGANPKGTARPLAAASEQTSKSSAITDVQITDIEKTPYGDEYYYTYRVRARILLPYSQCYVESCRAAITTRKRSYPEQEADMYEESSNPGWWSTYQLDYYGSPGDVITAAVTVDWWCPGTFESSKDKALP